MLVQMQQRRGTTAQWLATNPILAAGEIGLDTSLYIFKIGDGTQHWLDLPASGLSDTALAQLIAADGTLTQAAMLEQMNLLVAEAAEVQIAGVELAYSERASNFTTTSTTTPGTAITGLGITIVGKGRPVDIEMGALSLSHSVVNTQVVVLLNINGGVFFGGIAVSPLAGQGDSFYFKKRLVVPNGVSWAITASIYAGAAGTSTLQGQSTSPAYLMATSR